MLRKKHKLFCAPEEGAIKTKLDIYVRIVRLLNCIIAIISKPIIDENPTNIYKIYMNIKININPVFHQTYFPSK